MKRNNLCSFTIDQLSHFVVIAIISYLCSTEWRSYVTLHLSLSVVNIISIITIFLICAKPANILTKYILEQYHVESSNNDNYHSGALIGTLERWLILVFVVFSHYEAIGFLLAAKSLIRFKDHETIKSEYVLLGTLISVTIAVACSLIISILYDKYKLITL